VGILSSLGRTIRPALPAVRATSVPSGAWLGSIPTEVLEAFGVDVGATGPITRARAIRIPAMRRGRQIIAGTIGGLPLQALRPGAGGQLEVVERGATATLLGQLDPRTTRQWTLTWTVDDLLFGGLSWWRKLTVDADGWPLTVERLAPGRVTISGRQAYVDGQPVEDAELIRFDGPDDGVLSEGRESLQTCLLLEAAARRNATGLPPMDILRPAEGASDLTETEARELLDEWRTLRAENGTGWLNRAVEHETVGFDAKAAQLIETRQHQAVEVARMLNLDAQELNAPAATGMTYTNTEAKRRDLLDLSLAPYMSAITQRVGMPDVTPRGQVVRLDTTGFLRGTTADAISAATDATGGPVMTPAEAREGLLGLPGTPTQGQLPTPAPTHQEAPA
jgi:hypothetical protein